MKSYRVTVFNPNDKSDIHEWIIIKAKSEVILKEIVHSKGYEINGNINEVEIEQTFLDKIKDWFDKNFSTSYWYNPEYEVDMLDAFATAHNDWTREKEALEISKYYFWKSSKWVRTQIDQMIETYDKPWISHIYDVFVRNEEMFSESFLTLMKQTKESWAEVNFVKIISNPVEFRERGKKIEWYVELTRSINKLTNELKTEISKPLFWFLGMFWFIMAILVFIVPFMLEWFSNNVRDISNDFYFWVWEITIWTANTLWNYGLYILLLIIIAISLIIFFYRTNKSFKETIHKYILNMYIVWDIIALVYTKKVVSIIAIYHESWMSWKKIFEGIIPLVPFIPMKQELEYIWKQLWSYDYDTIFSSYDEDKFFTEMFYKQLSKESNSNIWAVTWRFGRAFAMIIKNTDDLWEKSVSKYPKKIGKFISIVWLTMIWIFTSGLLSIFMVTTINSI